MKTYTDRKGKEFAAIVVDQTVFHPQGGIGRTQFLSNGRMVGGQPSDTGVITGAGDVVLKVGIQELLG